MASTDFYERLSAHAASLKAKVFKFGRGEQKDTLPSAEDLDAVAEEDKARAETKSKPRKPKIIAQG